MKKIVIRSFVLLLLLILFCSSSVIAAPSPRLQLYFAPGIMNDATSEIPVDVHLKNYNLAIYDALGQICGITFSFQYNTEQFRLKENEDGSPEILLSEQTLLLSASDITFADKDGVVSFTFLDNTLGKRLIGQDGVLFRFTLLARGGLGFYNSTSRYPLRFVPGSLGIVTYETTEKNVNPFYRVEGIDINVGAYNAQPTLLVPEVNKTIQFTANSNTILIDGSVHETDATPFMQNGQMMVPIRYLTENAGMTVLWDDTAKTALAYTDYKTLSIFMQDGTVFVNAAQLSDAAPVNINGRIYIPADVISALYPEAQMTAAEETVTIYIP